MRADRALSLLLAAVFAGFPTMSMLRLLDRNHDVGRRETGDEVRLGHDVTIREGRAYLFTARSDDFPLAQFSGAVDGKGLHLIMSWPP